MKNLPQSDLRDSGRRTTPWWAALPERYPVALVMGIAAVIFLGTIFSPPSLMDDVDSVHAAIARTMLRSGDWITPRLDGVVYLDKSPMTYWAIAASYAVFGVHDWAARIPLAWSAILLCGVTVLFGAWAFGRKAGFYAGLALATCVGLFLFTRILIPEVMLTLSVTVTMWAFLRLLEDGEARPGLWAALMGASLGAGLLMKGLIAVVAPAGGAILYLLVTRQLFSWEVWRRLRPLLVITVALLIAASYSPPNVNPVPFDETNPAAFARGSTITHWV